MADRALVDVHAHYTTERYIEAAKVAGCVEPDGMPEQAWPGWSAAKHLELMDRLGIARSLLSLSSPGIHLPGVAVAEAAAEVNDAAAAATRSHPDRFGFFASVPMLDEAAGLREITRAFDELGAAGVIVMSNTAGAYLGDTRLQPILSELDRRGAIVFIHPTSPPGFAALSVGQPAPMTEFLFDTARTVIDFALSGAAERHPHLRLVIPHTGGVLPMLVERVEAFRALAPRRLGSLHDLLTRVRWDLAGVPNPSQLAALVALAAPGSLLFGSDYPWTHAHGVEQALIGLDTELPRHLTDWRHEVGHNAARLVSCG